MIEKIDKGAFQDSAATLAILVARTNELIDQANTAEKNMRPKQP